MTELLQFDLSDIPPNPSIVLPQLPLPNGK